MLSVMNQRAVPLLLLAGSVACAAPAKEVQTAREDSLSVMGWYGTTITPRAFFTPDSLRMRVEFPYVDSAATPEVTERMRSTLHLETVLGISEWLPTYEYGYVHTWYRIPFRQHGLLQVFFALQLQGGGAARLGWRTRVVDVRTGERLRVEQMFSASSLDELAGRVDARMQAALDSISARQAKLASWVDARIRSGLDSVSAGQPALDYPYVDEHGARKHFTVRDLENVSLSGEGVTFEYEFAFPERDIPTTVSTCSRGRNCGRTSARTVPSRRSSASARQGPASLGPCGSDGIGGIGGIGGIVGIGARMQDSSRGE